MVVENIEQEKIVELSNDFSKLFEVDISKHVSLTSEILEETLTRLEEFFSVMALVQNESKEEQLKTLLRFKTELATMGILVDRLESMVARVTQTVNEVETRLVNCEMDADVNKGAIRNLFKPFLKQPEPASQCNTQTTVFQPPEIYNTSDFFQQNEEDNI